MSIFIIVGGKKQNIFPTYLLIGHIAESERGKKNILIQAYSQVGCLVDLLLSLINYS